MQTKTLAVHDAVATVTAGGIAALGVKMPEDIRTSSVTARAYPHPALDGKVIVRLEPESIAAGTDAEMAAFGFGEPKVTKNLGQVRSRTLGFPAWALVNEPKKAKAALDVTEDVRKAKRLVQAKPGHAKDAFEKIAKQLSRTAPSFLPSFWEEVGRVVADQASTTMAAQFFEKARSAERAFKLKTNPDDTDAAFIEFALLGALSAKTLSAYAKELVKSAGGKEAYRRYKQIIVKRALGGMPPYSGMGKDLSSLAKSAGVDVEAEEDTLVAELVEAPGVGKAPIEFWTTYKDAILRLGKTKPEFRQRLRQLWPDPRGGNDDAKKAFYQQWIQHLDDVGALDDIPDEGLGAWVSKLFRYVGKTDKALDILKKLAPRLIELKQPISVVTPQPRWGSDLNMDLCELCLELGVPLADPDSSDDFYAESMTCDPVRIAADERYGKKLVEAVARFMGDSDHERRMHNKKGFEAARRRWIEEQLVELKDKPTSSITSTLETLESKTSAETFLQFPDLYEKLTNVDLAPTLAIHLRAGLADEFHWPAYEEAVKSLGEGEIGISGAWPILTIRNATKVLALDNSGVIAEHDLVYKVKDHTVTAAFYLDGQFLVDLDPTQGWKHDAYWSSAPKNLFETGVYFRTYGGAIPNQWNPPSGGVTMGDKAFRAGDTTITGSEDFYCDGTTMWKVDDGKYKVFDPATGKEGGLGQHEFLDASQWKRDGWDFEASSCVLLPAPKGVESSPLGVKNGLVGMRVRSKQQPNPDDWSAMPSEYERIDGARWEGIASVFALCSFPGDDNVRPIDRIEANGNPRFIGNEGPGIVIHDDKGDATCRVNEDLWASRGWGNIPVPPADFWDYVSPRDPEGSKALRGVTTEVARTLLQAAIAEVSASSEESGKRKLPQTEAAVRAAFPAIRSDALIAGVVGVCEHVAEVAGRVKEVATARSKENASADGRAVVGEAAHLRKLSNALAAGKPTKIPDCEADPREWMADGRVKAIKSLLPFTDEDERAKVRDMLRALAGTIFADDLSKMRVLELESPDDWDNPHDWSTVLIQPEGQAEDGSGGSVFALDPNNDWAIEISHDGQWRVPTATPGKPWKITESKTLKAGVGTEWAEKFLALPENIYEWKPEMAALLSTRADLTIPEATLLALGMPSGWGRDFLGKQKREAVGLKVNEADAARTTFQEIDDDKQTALWAKVVPDDPSTLADPLAPGGFFERLADAWKGKFGNRMKIPQDLIAAAKKELELGDDLGKFLPAFAGEDDIEWLEADMRPLPDLGGWQREKDYFDPDKAKQIATLIAWLFISRPVGDPIRANIPKVVRKIREMLEDPKVVWKLESLYGDDEDAKMKQRRAGLLEVVGGKNVEMAKDDDEECTAARDDGTVIVAQYKSRTYGGFRPGKLTANTRKKVEQLANLLTDPDDTYGDPLEPIKMAALLRSEEFGAFADRVEETEVPEGGFEANPLVSAPKLVKKVAEEHGISDEAAALYLQILALPEPTEARIKAWNAWKPKQYKDAAAEIVKKKLVVEGKRERAGRSIFVKGGYTKGKDKNLPMEEWKLPFFSSLERQIPAEPPHLLFARAWKRVQDGDKP